MNCVKRLELLCYDDDYYYYHYIIIIIIIINAALLWRMAYERTVFAQFVHGCH